jgi:tRNA threonylcarbamoyladenosine biosynthesis protein TsaB
MTDDRYLLAIDTATRWPFVALGQPDGMLIAQRQWQSRHGHAEQLLPSLDDLLTEVGATTANLAGVVVGIGPGSFTGLRIGLATAKVLAYSLDVPLAGVSTVRALAQASGGTDVVVALPAGAVDRYVVRYRDSVEVDGPSLVARPEAFAAATADAMLVAVDLDDAGLPPDAIERGRQAVERLAEAMLNIGARALAAGQSDDIATLVPAYVALPRGITNAAEQMQWSPDLR